MEDLGPARAGTSRGGGPGRGRAGALGRRVVAAVNRDPADARHVARDDALLAAALMALSVPLALLAGGGNRPDALGWTLLLCGQAPLVWRRRHTTAALAAMIAFLGPYHALGNPHVAPIPGSMFLLFTVAATGPPRRALIAGIVVIGGTVTANWISDAGGAAETLRTSGWIAAVLVAGANVRVHRRLVAATVHRAERAEHTREEVAARRVAEERLRIARDLHDLLAHSITLIGVQTSVASHVLTVAPEEFDRAAVVRALDDIAGTCRTARAEVRTTLEVLREGEGDGDGERPGGAGPLPGLAALPDLARPAGARLTVSGAEEGADAAVPPAAQAAAYRIVQEALTNTTRHAGSGARAEVTVRIGPDALLVEITDNGRTGVAGSDPAREPTQGSARAPAPDPDEPSGFGLIGMRERARSVGGTLTAGPRPQGGFAVSARLPLAPRTAQEDPA